MHCRICAGRATRWALPRFLVQISSSILPIDILVSFSRALMCRLISLIKTKSSAVATHYVNCCTIVGKTRLEMGGWHWRSTKVMPLFDRPCITNC